MSRIVLCGDRKLSITVKDYWEKSLNGFGSYTKEVSHAVFEKHTENHSRSISNRDYVVEFIQLGDDYFMIVKK